MKRFRRQRLRTAVSLLAMVALMWSQLLLASHPACTLASMAADAAQASLASHANPERAPCHPAPSRETSPACESHCSRSDLSQDVSRALAVPALGPMPAVPVVTVQHLPQDIEVAQAPRYLRSWHRPTAHPASLLLI